MDPDQLTSETKNKPYLEKNPCADSEEGGGQGVRTPPE